MSWLQFYYNRHSADVQGRVNHLATLDKCLVAAPYRWETEIYKRKAALLGYTVKDLVVTT
jgi:hypothetical protein